MKDERNQGKSDPGEEPPDLDKLRYSDSPEEWPKGAVGRTPRVVIEASAAEVGTGEAVQFEAKLLAPHPRGNRVTISWELVHRTDEGKETQYKTREMEIPDNLVPWFEGRSRPTPGGAQEQPDDAGRGPILVCEDDPLRITIDTGSLSHGECTVDATIHSVPERKEGN